ncbi:MAG: M1 family aminopeptidase [bacterium]|nr:M1 family aminopeptidase [bacterium]
MVLRLPHPRRSATLLAALAAAAAAATAAPAPSPEPPPEAAYWERPGWPAALPSVVEPAPRADDRGYDVLHYDLDLRLDPTAGSVAGSVELTLAFPAGRPPDTLVVDLDEPLAVDAVDWDQSPVTLERAGEELRIAAPAGAAAGAVVRIGYHGQPQRHGAYSAGMLFRVQGDSPQVPIGPTVLTMSEPWSAHAWWPCKDHPADKATARLALTVPDSLTAVANGRLTADEPAEPGWRRTVWETGYPTSTYLIAVHVAGYAAWEETCDLAGGPLPLTFHVFPRHEAAARFDLAPTCDMLGFLEDLVGPYPFADERYGQVEFKWGGAMEHQTCTSLGSVVLRGDGRFRNVILHEMAHHWFGDLVTPADWPDVWLNEGFATYCEALWLEHEEGPAAMRRRLESIGPGQHPTLFEGEGLLADPEPVLPNILVYHKGAWVLHMLRGALGDDAFRAFLRDWVGSPQRAYAHATTADLIRVVGEHATFDAAAFLEPWLHTDAVPYLSWTSSPEPTSDGGTRVTVALRQLQRRPFQLAVPLRLLTDRAERDTTVWLHTSQQSWTFDLPGDWKGLEVDPDGWVLMARRPLPDPPVRLLSVHPTPAGPEGATLALRVTASGPVAVELVDAAGRRRGRWQLGELAARDEPYPWRWRGEDGDGRPVPSGIYWLSVSGGGGRSAAKVVLVR